MQEITEKLVSILFKKNSLQECTTEELSDLTNRYPFFSTAQLLNTRKLKEENNPSYQQHLEKTSIYFNNPLWLDFVLRNHDALIHSSSKTEFTSSFEDSHNDELVITNTGQKISHREHNATPGNFMPAENILTEEKKEKVVSGLVFEPYHTVDYFASQGVKPIIDDKPKDRFGQQLKSFTEWLKTIRQMPPQQIAVLSDTRNEEKVIQLADHSIEDRNVVTEAMAEVWIKQGHPEKALEIYHKLSLLNPSKISYFASLIENLKKT
jgi:hypothetical protein